MNRGTNPVLGEAFASWWDRNSGLDFALIPLWEVLKGQILVAKVSEDVCFGADLLGTALLESGEAEEEVWLWKHLMWAALALLELQP